MLAAAQRLRRREDFAATIRGGRRAGRGGVVVHVLAAPQTSSDSTGVGSPRAGFVVSKAVGNAVVRNLVRRRLRHLVRARLAGLPAGADVVVRALPASAARPYADLGADLDAALAAALGGGRRRDAGRSGAGRSGAALSGAGRSGAKKSEAGEL